MSLQIHVKKCSLCKIIQSADNLFCVLTTVNNNFLYEEQCLISNFGVQVYSSVGR